MRWWLRALTTMAGLALFVAGLGVSPLASATPVGIPVDPADSGEAIAFGDPASGRTDVPPLPPGTTYTAAAAGVGHTLLLRSDGAVVAFGDNAYGQVAVPPLPAGLRYTAVAAGTYHSVLLRSDGNAFVLGMDMLGSGATTVPPLPPGVTYTGVAAGAWHTAFLRSDGQAVGVGYDADGRATIPALSPGTSYTRLAAGYNNTVLVRSDGHALVLGILTDSVNPVGVPALPPGLTYVDAVAGTLHAVLLRSDGSVIAVGYGVDGQTAVPALPPGTTYTAIAAGQWHTVLLRSDGQAVAFGRNSAGQATVPPLPPGTRYTAAAAGEYHTVLIRAVAPLDTTTTLAGPPTATPGDGITLAATVTPQAAGPAFTGAVRFVVDGSTTVDVPIDAEGGATTTVTLSGGTHVTTATYLGATDGRYRASAPSNAVTTTVPYVVTFDAGAGDAVPPALVAPGALVPPPADPARPGHAFTGWRTGGPAGPLWDFASDAVTGDLVLVAGWRSDTPQLAVSPASAAPGDRVTVTGTGFVPGESVTLTINPTLGSVVADVDGAFAVAFTVPALSPGRHTIAAHRGDADDPVVATVDLTVAALATTPLATTGLEPASLVALGGALLALGALAVGVRLGRRRAARGRAAA